MVKAAKEPAAIAEQNGHLTTDDEYRRKVGSELSDAYRVLAKAQMRFEQAKAQQKSAKGDVERAQQDVNDLVSEIRDIELGQYQPDLFDQGKGENEAGGTGAKDEGAGKPIDILRQEFSLTEKTIELLQQSKLEIKTVGDLEKAIRTDEWWHKKVEGVGPKGIDKIIDALMEFRKTYPVPAADEPEPAQAEAQKPAGTPTPF